MKKTSLSVFLLIAMVSVVILSGCGAKNEATPAQGASDGEGAGGPQVVKAVLNTTPVPRFSYLDENNKSVGFIPDYLEELQKRLPEYRFEYDLADNEGQLVGTDTGKYAFAANFWFKNPEREKKYLYPEQELGYSITVLAVKSNRDDIKTLDDLVGKKLVPMTPVSGFRYIIKDYNLNHPGREIVIEDVDKSSQAEDLKLVDSGKYDAHFLNLVHFEDVMKKLNLDLKVGGIISKEPVYLLFNKNQTELAAKVDAVTKEMIADGTLPKLSEKWFGVDVYQNLDYIKQGYQFRQDG
jgi:L-cystine transport system substrate-binding protein